MCALTWKPYPGSGPALNSPPSRLTRSRIPMMPCPLPPMTQRWGAVLTAVAYDVGAFFVGRSFGQRPLATASPNKTFEGLAGGWIAAIGVAVVIVGLISPWGDISLGDKLLFGIAAAAAPADAVGQGQPAGLGHPAGLGRHGAGHRGQARTVVRHLEDQLVLAVADQHAA